VAKAKKAPGVGAKGSGRGGVNGGKGGKVPPEATATIELGSSDEDDIVDWLDDPVPSSAHNAVASSSRHDPVPKTSPDPLAMPPFSFNLTNQATSNERSIRAAEGVVREQVKKLDARDAASRKTAVSSMKSKVRPLPSADVVTPADNCRYARVRCAPERAWERKVLRSLRLQPSLATAFRRIAPPEYHRRVTSSSIRCRRIV
jgi:hypothetical protein